MFSRESTLPLRASTYERKAVSSPARATTSVSNAGTAAAPGMGRAVRRARATLNPGTTSDVQPPCVELPWMLRSDTERPRLAADATKASAADSCAGPASAVSPETDDDT